MECMILVNGEAIRRSLVGRRLGPRASSASFRWRGTRCGESLAGRSSRRIQQFAHSHQVVGSSGEGKHPADTVDSLVAGLSHDGDGLQPTEDLLDSFAGSLTHLVSGMPGCPPVDRAPSVADVLRDMRSHALLPQLTDEIACVVALVGAESDSRATEFLDHFNGCLSLSGAGGVGHA